MKTLLLSLLLTGCIASSHQDVFICDSQSAYRYHYKARCRGLGNCRHAVVRVSLEEAQDRGRTLCKWEQ